MVYAFVVGCPRSGTTWLQMLLAQHPSIATAQETHLFDGYIGRLQDSWTRDEAASRGIGLQAALTRDQFDALCARMARDVLSRIASRVDGASVVLEKTPAHVRRVRLILKLLPEARFIHLVRDPRAAVASLCAAGRSWGRAWASADPVDNARLWVSDVSAGREIASLTNHHYTVKYEDLRGNDGWQVLQAMFKWLGLDATDGFCRQAVTDCAIDKLRGNNNGLKAGKMISGDPPGFYRKGSVDSWRDDLSQRDVRAVEYIAGDLMRAYGYPASSPRGGSADKPMRVKTREILESLEWRARRGLAWGFDTARRLM